MHRGLDPRQFHKKLCSICTNCCDRRITIEYTLNASDCVSVRCELRKPFFQPSLVFCDYKKIGSSNILEIFHSNCHHLNDARVGIVMESSLPSSLHEITIKHNYLSRNLVLDLNTSTASRGLLQQTEVMDKITVLL